MCTRLCIHMLLAIFPGESGFVSMCVWPCIQMHVVLYISASGHSQSIYRLLVFCSTVACNNLNTRFYFASGSQEIETISIWADILLPCKGRGSYRVGPPGGCVRSCEAKPCQGDCCLALQKHSWVSRIFVSRPCGNPRWSKYISFWYFFINWTVHIIKFWCEQYEQHSPHVKMPKCCDLFSG